MLKGRCCTSRLKKSRTFEVLIQHLNQADKSKVVKARSVEKKASDVFFLLHGRVAISSGEISVISSLV